jgi:hypothetical protein
VITTRSTLTAESGPARDVEVAVAKAVCGWCPVRPECLDEARIPYGIAGGLTEHERRTLRRSDTHRTAELRAKSEDVLRRNGPRPGLTAMSIAQQRARIGRRLLATGRDASQVARACGVSTRTVQRWATSTTSTTSSTTGTTGTAGTGGVTSARDRGVGEGSRGGHRPPLGTSHRIDAQAGTRAVEGQRA